MTHSLAYKPYRRTHREHLMLNTSPWLGQSDSALRHLNADGQPFVDDAIIVALDTITEVANSQPSFRFVHDRRDVMETLVGLGVAALEVGHMESGEDTPYEFTPDEQDALIGLFTFLLQDLLLTFDEDCFTPGLFLKFHRRAGNDILIEFAHHRHAMTPAGPQQRSLIYRAWNCNGQSYAEHEEDVHVRYWS